MRKKIHEKEQEPEGRGRKETRKEGGCIFPSSQVKKESV